MNLALNLVAVSSWLYVYHNVLIRSRGMQMLPQIPVVGRNFRSYCTQWYETEWQGWTNREPQPGTKNEIAVRLILT